MSDAAEPAESLSHPAYGRLRPVTDTASVLLADNPGLLTLEGTNTWVLRGPGSDELVIVDPGPDDDEHIARVAALGRIALVLISHRHGDHTDGIDKLVELTGATVRSAGSGFLRGLGGELIDGEVIDAAGPEDHRDGDPRPHRRFVVVRPRRRRADRGHGVGPRHHRHRQRRRQPGRLPGIAAPAARPGPAHRCCPGTGRTCADLEAVASGYLAHRQERLEQVRSALRELGDDATARQIVEHVYVDVDEKLWDAAEWSVQAQLDYLRG